jgi:hypothetical protein
MYKTLWMDDIVHKIFTYLQPALNTPYCEETQTLFNAALVCKHFSSHALDALWSVMYNLKPLVDLILSIICHCKSHMVCLLSLCTLINIDNPQVN